MGRSAYYETGQACLNGHAITGYASSSPERSQAHCSQCGAPTIVACPNCSAPLHGEYMVPGVFIAGLAWTPDDYCYSCGQPYPWQAAAEEATAEMARELFFLAPEDRELLAKSIPDLLRETPRTNLAISRVKRLLARTGEESGKQFLAALKDVAVAVVTKELFGP